MLGTFSAVRPWKESGLHAEGVAELLKGPSSEEHDQIYGLDTFSGIAGEAGLEALRWGLKHSGGE